MKKAGKQLAVAGGVVAGAGLLTWLLWPKAKAPKPESSTVPVVWTQGGELPPPPIDLPKSRWVMLDVSSLQTAAGRAKLAAGLPNGTIVRLVLSNPEFGIPPSVYRVKVLGPSGPGVYVLQWIDFPQVERDGIVVSFADYYQFSNKNVFL